jgi:hypothetical protein
MNETTVSVQPSALKLKAKLQGKNYAKKLFEVGGTKH